MASITHLENGDDLLEALDDSGPRGAVSEERRRLEDTRKQLETPPEPTIDDGANDAATAAELETDGAGTDLTIEEVEEDLGVDLEEYDDPEEVREAYADGKLDDVDLEVAIETVLEEAAAEEKLPGYRMTEDRRVGSHALPVDGEGAVRFGKPSGRASLEILEKIDEVESEGGAITDLAGFLWGTLESWSVEEEYDRDWWADEVALVDAVTTARNVALGGNAPTG